MGFWKHDTEFFDKLIYDFTEEGLKAVDKNVPRLAIDYDAEDGVMQQQLLQLVADPLAEELGALVIGAWGQEMYENPPGDILETLIAAAPQLPSLKALFWGDITAEECEISWIHQSDLSALIEAFPKLEMLRIRGSIDLSLGSLKLDHLKALIIETGGLGSDVVAQIANSQLPSLEHLEVYFGDDDYGGNCTVENARTLMSAGKFPKVNRLGLRNAPFADEIAGAILESDILPQLKVLDLSLGTLGDEGGSVLVESGKLAHLDWLILDSHYMSEAVTDKFEELEIGVSLEGGQGAAAVEDRYVSVSE